MSFRDNLQHLRTTRNMTQEQLAMLLGVSRQSVTKWEAGKSCPEMDKLLKLCQIFECSLDDLVQGDLAARTPAPSSAVVPAGPPTDVCGYDEHQRRLAWQVPSGVAAILAGCGLGLLLEGRASLPGGDSDILMVALVFLGILAGLALLVPAGMEHAAFVRAHPYVEDFYDEADRARARRDMARGLVGGIAAIFVGVVCLMVLGESRATEREGLCLLLLLTAAGVWLIVRYGMLLGRTNVAEYNRSAAEDLEMEGVVSTEVSREVREALVGRRRTSAVCGAIMILATIVGLALLFVPVFSAKDPSGFDPAGTSATWFWVAWPVGGMLCGVVTLLMRAFSREDDER